MICTKCKKTVRVVSKFLDDQLSNSLEIAGEITNEVAKVINNPLFQLLLSQIPDSVNKQAVLSVIEKVLSTTSNIAKCENLTGLDKINCLMNALNILPKDERNSVLLRLKSALTAYLDGNRFEKFVYDTAGQFDYFNEKIKGGFPVEAKSDFIEPVKEVTEQKETVVSIAESVLNDKPEFTHAMPMQASPELAEAPKTPQAF